MVEREPDQPVTTSDCRLVGLLTPARLGRDSATARWLTRPPTDESEKNAEASGLEARKERLKPELELLVEVGAQADDARDLGEV